MGKRTIAVIGLGYVGLPVAASFGQAGFDVIGFDIDERRVHELSSGVDRTCEVAAKVLSNVKLSFSTKEEDLRGANFFIVTVPTPIDLAKRPSLFALKNASETVGKALKHGDIVVYESTVYPGATEEDCLPILEQVSGLHAGKDFKVGYSPERINPGDKTHRFDSIVKVVSGQDADTLEEIARVYGQVVTAGIHKAPTIKVAEAAKVIENTQRDLNIALMNELSTIFSRLGIDTMDVLAAAGTKWNFLPFTPGLVGGHCIGVDPYYLTHRAEMQGYNPQVILAGRRINDTMAERIAREGIKLMNKNGITSRRVGILGLTFKEDVPDVRNTRVIDMIREFESFGLEVLVHDPYADAQEVSHEFGIELADLDRIKDCGLSALAVPHSTYLTRGWNTVLPMLSKGKAVVLDVKAKLERAECPNNVILWRP
jgi:UDP-N-acetyl-D-galactosamine dehydrogenase